MPTFLQALDCEDDCFDVDCPDVDCTGQCTQARVLPTCATIFIPPCVRTPNNLECTAGVQVDLVLQTVANDLGTDCTPIDGNACPDFSGTYFVASGETAQQVSCALACSTTEPSGAFTINRDYYYTTVMRVSLGINQAGNSCLATCTIEVRSSVITSGAIAPATPTAPTVVDCVNEAITNGTAILFRQHQLELGTSDDWQFEPHVTNCEDACNTIEQRCTCPNTGDGLPEINSSQDLRGPGSGGCNLQLATSTVTFQ